jgi:hypothetical protein
MSGVTSQAKSEPAKAAPGTLAFAWEHRTSKDAIQMSFARGNRKAWITRLGARKWDYRFAFANDTTSQNGGVTKTMTSALYQVSDWLRDARVSA